MINLIGSARFHNGQECYFYSCNKTNDCKGFVQVSIGEEILRCEYCNDYAIAAVLAEKMNPDVEYTIKGSDMNVTSTMNTRFNMGDSVMLLTPTKDGISVEGPYEVTGILTTQYHRFLKGNPMPMKLEDVEYRIERSVGDKVEELVSIPEARLRTFEEGINYGS